MFKPFILLLSPHHISESQSNVEISLPDRSQISPFEVPRSLWTPEQIQSHRLWLGGGGACLINSRYVPLIQRSATAPSYPGHLTIQTGLPDRAEELYFPQQLMREFFEELIIINDCNELATIDFVLEGCAPELMAPVSEATAEQLGLSRQGHRSYQGRLLREICSDRVTILANGRPINTFECVLHFNETTRAYNAIFPLAVDLESDAMSARFYDGEMLETKGSMHALKRPVFLYDVSRHVLVDPTTGDLTNLHSFPITPHAQEVLQRLSKHLHGVLEWSK